MSDQSTARTIRKSLWGVIEELGDPVTVDTAEFRRTSALSRLLRRALRRAILPRCDPGKRPAYESQFDEASRNVEIMVEGLLGLLAEHPIKTVHVLRALSHWRNGYYPMQNACRTRMGHLVYTQHDRAIPFRPESDILYAYMVCQISYVARELADVVSGSQMKHVAHTFMGLNRTALEAFERYPTLMPRYLDHDRITLAVVQSIDDPTNCCPSLHIAYSLLLDNLASFMIKPLRNKRQAFDAIRFSTIGMFNSVLYTKQHALIDVAFGILCAKVVFEASFDHPFDDFTSVLRRLEREHPIRYSEAIAIYEEICEMQAGRTGIADTLGEYLEAHGYPEVRCDQPIAGAWFDTRRPGETRSASDP